MLNFARPLTLLRVAAAIAALWLCLPQPAKAGDGADLAGLQNYINDVCSTFSMSSCPQIPTITQAVLQVAAFVDIAPEAVRPNFHIPVGPYVDAGNPSRPPGAGCSALKCTDPLNPILALPIDPGVLSTLRPLAFRGASSGNGTASPTQLYDLSATAFFYAVGGSTKAGSPQPDTLVLFYDDPARTAALSPGQVAAKVSLPLTVLNKDGTERSVPTILQYQAPALGAAPCSASTVTGNFSGSSVQTLSPAKIGVNCALVLASSPVSASSHAILEVTVPMLITSGTDPAIVGGSFIGFGDPFLKGGGDFGFTFSSGKSIGIGPNARPFGPPATTTATYALCANLATDSSPSTLVPSVAAFYAIAGDGEILVSAPLAPSISITCPAM